VAGFVGLISRRRMKHPSFLNRGGVTPMAPRPPLEDS